MHLRYDRARALPEETMTLWLETISDLLPRDSIQTIIDAGCGTEALQLWVDYLFSNSDVHRTALATYSLNPRMIGLAEKVRFVHEGRDSEIVEWHGK